MADKEKFRFLGYDKVYDVIQIMLMQFNPKEEVLKRYVLNDGLYGDKKRVEQLLDLFNIGLNPQIKFLFNATIQKASFFSDYYVKQLDQFGYIEFSDFIKIIDTDTNLQQEILKYHLGDMLSKEDDIAHVILFGLDATYSAEKKEGLMRLLFYFEETKGILINELIRVGNMLDHQYEIHQNRIEKMRKSLAKIKYCDEETEQWIKKKKSIEVKISLISPYLLWWGDIASGGGMILGIEYERVMQASWNAQFSLAKFCEAMGDEVRNNILVCIKENKCLSIGEIASSLDLSIPIVTYHINKLKEMRVIYREKEQKVSKYYLNTDSIQNAIEKLKLFLEDKNDG